MLILGKDVLTEGHTVQCKGAAFMMYAHYKHYVEYGHCAPASNDRHTRLSLKRAGTLQPSVTPTRTSTLLHSDFSTGPCPPTPASCKDVPSQIHLLESLAGLPAHRACHIPRHDHTVIAVHQVSTGETHPGLVRHHAGDALEHWGSSRY